MGVLSNLRGPRAGHTNSQQGESSISENGLSSSPPASLLQKKKWSNLMPLFVALVIISEIAFLGRLDMAKNAAMLDSLADMFSKSPPSIERGVMGGEFGAVNGRGRIVEAESCEEWLEREDAVVYSRDFEKNPVLVSGGEKEWKTCFVGCKFEFNPSKTPDAAFGLPQPSETASVHRSMESAQYYAENDIAHARRKGFNIVMTTSLSSDVPVGYFSWAEYDIMAPVQPKIEKALAAAFISNCGARNFRLQAVEALEKANIQIDSYGGCHRNRNGNVNKVETLKHYKFSLAFENSNEEDYVTEKFFQSLVAGTVPVVIGAPNIEDFAPSPNSILHIRELEDVEPTAKTMKYLAENPDAFNQSLRWKFEGPSDSFKALVDMAAVHSSCRLCIHLATMIREREETTSTDFKKRPCKCNRGSETVYHLYVRERGRFEMESVFLSISDAKLTKEKGRTLEEKGKIVDRVQRNFRISVKIKVCKSGSMTLEGLESAVLTKFKSIQHVPIWKQERPESLRGGDELKIYKVYPVGLTQRQALYSFKFSGDADLRKHIESNPCPKFEVIFV